MKVKISVDLRKDGYVFLQEISTSLGMYEKLYEYAPTFPKEGGRRFEISFDLPDPYPIEKIETNYVREIK